MRSHRRLFAAALAVLAVASACITPPAVLAALDVDRDGFLSRYPASSETIELPRDSGGVLRGVFVPAGDGAPVVLHLLESSGSVASSFVPHGPLCAELADLGFASLVVDYSGVGVSDGERSVLNLAADARAMWTEAVKRAGGEQRVIVRATSLGTIASSRLIADGARPRGLEWILPVDPKTVSGRFADHFYGPLVGAFARVFLRPIADIGPLDVAEHLSVPTLVLVAREDSFLSLDERRRLETRLHEGPHSIRERPGDHFELTAFSMLLAPEEIVWFAARSGRDWTADELRTLRIEWAVGRRARASKLQPEFVDALLDLSDPAGALPIDLLETAARIENTQSKFVIQFVPSAATLPQLCRGEGMFMSRMAMAVSLGTVRVEIVRNPPEFLAQLLARGLLEADARRQLARLMLKALLIPDRVRVDAGGHARLEYFVDGAWHSADAAEEVVAPEAAPLE